ncbi:MAG: nickel pincer cofactor biosynthesis protein LarC [Myxococcota bacterium]|nr:nickel pincer cofactor biosynthesis protein LarC [Myxococcota bacterium]
MSNVFIDPIGGIAGDMLCAALLDMGLHESQWREALRYLPLTNYDIVVQKCKRGSFSATHMQISPHVRHAHTHQNIEHWEHTHRHHHTIQTMIADSKLGDRTKARASAVFQKLAEAEGTIHNQSPDQVHFHEVGAVDSILDIVGFCIGLELLEIEQVFCAPPPLSLGVTQVAHGYIPLPSPATASLLQGRAVRSGFPNHEQTTPTGAAIVAALCEESAFPNGTFDKVGYGAGTRNPKEYPNILRTFLFSTPCSPILQIETQIDDMTGEELPLLFERCLQAGALDIFATPVLMKKGRAGFLLNVLVRQSKQFDLEEVLFQNTSTFGIRYYPVSRTELLRRYETIQTKWGDVRIKIGSKGDDLLQASVEYEDAATLAKQNHISIRTVMNEALYQWRSRS